MVLYLSLIHISPDLYKAYIGIAQITGQPESEKLAYEYMLDYYEEIGDKKTLRKLRKTSYDSKEYGRIRAVSYTHLGRNVLK